jgi:hypothetical protein
LFIDLPISGCRGKQTGNQAHDAADFVAQAKRLQEEYTPELWLADPAEPRSIEKFRRHDIPARAAVNDIMPGIETVAAAAPRLSGSDSGCSPRVTK